MEQIPKVVVQRLQTTAKPGVHPDPDLINAFVQNSLKTNERNQVLEHLAHCNDCREVITLSLPEHSDAIVPSAASASPTWLSWPILRWGALAACVVMVGAAVTLRYESRLSSRQPGPGQAAEVNGLDGKTAAATSRAESPLEAAKQNLQGSAGKSDIASSPAGGTRADSRAPDRFGTRAAAEQALDHNDIGERKLASKKAEAAEPAAVARVAPAPPGNMMDRLVPGRAKDVPEEAQASNTPAAVDEGILEKQKAAPSAGMAGKTQLSLPANPLPRWTLGPDGTLQRSLDSGKTWETVSVASQLNIRALAANGFDIWVGGSRGVLYHSSDAGQHWTQVQPAANGESLTADIIAVEFVDLSHGTITTSTKDIWLTDDAGQSWRKK